MPFPCSKGGVAVCGHAVVRRIELRRYDKVCSRRVIVVVCRLTLSVDAVPTTLDKCTVCIASTGRCIILLIFSRATLEHPLVADVLCAILATKVSKCSHGQIVRS
jgi:hypothetical protein